MISIGNTPLIRLEWLTQPGFADIYVIYNSFLIIDTNFLNLISGKVKKLSY